jgi:hypothetical protein
MLPSAALCVKPRPLFLVLSLALGCDARAQADERDALIQELRQRMEALEKKLEEKPPAPPPSPASGAGT